MRFQKERWFLVCCGLVFVMSNALTANAQTVAQAVAPIAFEGLARACAGGIEDDVHTFALKLKVDESLRNQEVALRFDGNRGHDYGDGRARKTAKLRIGKGAWRETLTARVGKDRVLDVEVLSSDIVCKMRLVATVGEKEIGEVWCDFGEAMDYRRFTNPFDKSETEDNGWLFNGELYPAGSIYKAKIYRKFKIDPTLGDVNGNWKVVNGHNLKFSLEVELSQINPKPDEILTKSEEVKAYASIVDFEDTTRTKTVITRNDGAASVAIKIGKKAAPVALVTRASDQSQWEDKVTLVSHSLSTIPIHKLPDLKTEGDPVEWFSLPPDIRANVVYRDIKTYPDWTYKAHRLGESSTRDRVVFDAAALNEGVTDKGRRSFYNLHLSPDGQSAFFHVQRVNQDFDNCHDLYVGDISSGKYRLAQDYLFGDSERWSHDSGVIAYVGGSMDTIFGTPVAPLITLNTVGIKNGGGLFLEDNNLNRDDLNWSPHGDLFFSSFSPIKKGSSDSAPMLHEASTHGGIVNLGIGHKASASPDGKWLAFYGLEDMNRPYAFPQMALCVMRPDGSERRAINRRPNGTQPDILWTPDSKKLVELDGEIVREWDLETRRFRDVTKLQTTPIPFTYADESWRNRLIAQRVSKNGKYLFLANSQYVNRKGSGYSNRVLSWLALDLQSGDLHKLAIFRNGDFDWHEDD